jgi:hypothetical protein
MILAVLVLLLVLAGTNSLLVLLLFAKHFLVVVLHSLGVLTVEQECRFPLLSFQAVLQKPLGHRLQQRLRLPKHQFFHIEIFAQQIVGQLQFCAPPLFVCPWCQGPQWSLAES